ncbi:MAG: universal stress protein [Desulfocapsa sp.]|nr:MAG: universal stress protein [Desulfocapsa sp.]
MKKEIVAAIDGSLYSDHALAYITALFAKDETFHIHLSSWITVSASVMPSIADDNNSLIPSGDQNKKEVAAKRYLKKAKEKLLKSGIAEERIQTSVVSSGYNVAATIQQHVTEKLPDSLIIGRRGFRGITRMLMGSVSAEIFRRCHSTPLWIIDGKIKHKDFFVPVDGTLTSLLAVDHLSHILSNRNDIRICLFHHTSLFDKKPVCDPEQFSKYWDRKWCQEHLTGDKCLFEGPKQILLEAGIPEDKIVILPLRTGLEKAHGIIREARKQKCGTIVMGRRSAGMAKGLFGGVSDRTIEHVENLALWVIG